MNPQVNGVGKSISLGEEDAPRKGVRGLIEKSATGE